MTEYQLAAMDRAGETGEPIFRAPSVGCSGETERELDLYDEIECDLPSLFGRAAAEGHESSQRLALQVRAKMQRARAAVAKAEDETVRCETCDGSGRVVETIDVDVPGHNRAGSYDVMATCQDCDGAGLAATGETS